MRSKYLVAAIGVLLGAAPLGIAGAGAQGAYPDVERQHEQHEKNVEQKQMRKAQHREQQTQHQQRREQQLERHDQKVGRKNELRTEGATETQQPQPQTH